MKIRKINFKILSKTNTSLNHVFRKLFCKRINKSSLSELLDLDKKNPDHQSNFTLKNKTFEKAAILTSALFCFAFIRYEFYFLSLTCGFYAVYKYIKLNSTINLFLNQLDENFTEKKNKQINFAVK